MRFVTAVVYLYYFTVVAIFAFTNLFQLAYIVILLIFKKNFYDV